MIWNESEPEERQKPALWIGLGGAAVAALFALFLPHEASVWRLPQVLKQRVAESLTAAGMPGLVIEMSGQHATLRGVVESEADIPTARHAALTAAGPGGAWSGGITSVDVSGLHVGPFTRPYVWTAQRGNGRLVLAGSVPSEETRQSILREAESMPNTQVVNQMRVAGGATSPLFSDLAEQALTRLRLLRTGEVRIADNQIVLVGEGSDSDVKALRRAYAAPQAPYRVRIEAWSDGLDLAHPELQGINLVSGNAAACTQAFARLTEQRNLGFAANSALIDSRSHPLLDALTSVALHCDRFAINVRGPAQGGAVLSRARAQTVTAYFASQGVWASRLNADAGTGAGVSFDVAGGPP